MKTMNKKGIQLNEAFGAVLTVVILGILIIISLVMFNSIGTTLDTDGVSVTVANESFNFNATQAYNVSARGAKDFSGFTIISLINNTGVSLSSGNWSKGSNGLISVGQNNLSVVNMTYSYTFTQETAASNATLSSITNFSQYPALLGLVGTIIFLGIIIGVLVASFAFGGNKA